MKTSTYDNETNAREAGGKQGPKAIGNNRDTFHQLNYSQELPVSTLNPEGTEVSTR